MILYNYPPARAERGDEQAAKSEKSHTQAVAAAAAFNAAVLVSGMRAMTKTRAYLRPKQRVQPNNRPTYFGPKNPPQNLHTRRFHRRAGRVCIFRREQLLERAFKVPYALTHIAQQQLLFEASSAAVRRLIHARCLRLPNLSTNNRVHTTLTSVRFLTQLI